MDTDRIEGAGQKFMGRVEESLGSIGGDAKLQADGKADRAAGTVKNAFGGAKDSVREMADQAADAMPGVSASIRDTARKIGSKASEAGEEVYVQASNAGRYAGEQIREQPLAALLLAGVVGGVMGFLLARR